MSARAAPFSRRGFCLAGAGAGLWLEACGRKPGRPAAADDLAPAPVGPSGPAAGTLEWAAAGNWRTPADKARDAWRHPVQSLRFWGLKPGMTVLEVWPALGGYSDILAPYLERNGGRLIAAQFPGSGPAEAKVVTAYRAKLAARPGLYGAPTITTFGPTSGPLAPGGSVDLALFLLTLHSWMAAGLADKAFHDAFRALKPGGVLGVEAPRAPPGGVQDALASDGYVQEAYVKQLASEAGLRFDGSSEINANPKDDRVKPGAADESDRMTLRFVKPR